MSFEEEWEEIKQKSSQQRSEQMKLAGLDGEGGFQSPSDLVVHDDELGAVGSDAYKLFQQLSQDGRHASESSAEAAKVLADQNLDLGRALSSTVKTWSTQVKTLMEACRHISNHLDYTVKSHQKNEEKIATDMENKKGFPMTISRINDYFN